MHKFSDGHSLLDSDFDNDNSITFFEVGDFDDDNSITKSVTSITR